MPEGEKMPPWKKLTGGVWVIVNEILERSLRVSVKARNPCVINTDGK